MIKCDTKNKLCKLFASSENFILTKKKGSVFKDTIITEFLDSSNVICEVVVNNRYHIDIKRLGKTLYLNNMVDFKNTLQILLATKNIL